MDYTLFFYLGCYLSLINLTLFLFHEDYYDKSVEFTEKLNNLLKIESTLWKEINLCLLIGFPYAIIATGSYFLFSKLQNIKR